MVSSIAREPITALESKVVGEPPSPFAAEESPDRDAIEDEFIQRLLVGGDSGIGGSPSAAEANKTSGDELATSSNVSGANPAKDLDQVAEATIVDPQPKTLDERIAEKVALEVEKRIGEM